MKKFLNVLKADLHRAFFSSGFIIGIITTFAVFCFGSVGMVTTATSAVMGFNNTYKYNNISQLFSLTATFAYSASFCVDWQSRFDYLLIARSKKNMYLLSKCLATVIAGGMSVALGALLYMGALCMIQPEILPPESLIEMQFSWQAFGDLLVQGKAGLFFGAYLLIIFLQAAFFACLGLTASAYLPNKYVAYIVPFILGFFMNQAANILKLPVWLDPIKLATAKVTRTPTTTILLGAMALYFSLTVVCMWIFIRRAKRRLANG